MGAVEIGRIEIMGCVAPPWNLKLEIFGQIGVPLDDAIVDIMHDYEEEFRREVAAAFERVYIARFDEAREGEQKSNIGDIEL